MNNTTEKAGNIVTDVYEDGLRDGKIEALEKMQSHQNQRLDVFGKQFEKCDARLRLQEKVVWGLIGAIALVQFLPELKIFLAQ